MTIHGYKTKIGCTVMVVAAVVSLFYLDEGLSLFMVGIALSVYGLYDRGKRNTTSHGEKIDLKIDELKSRIKKPMLRGSL